MSYFDPQPGTDRFAGGLGGAVERGRNMDCAPGLNLRRNEQAFVGLAVGLVMEDLLVNFLAFVLPFELACWIGLGWFLSSGWFVR